MKTIMLHAIKNSATWNWSYLQESVAGQTYSFQDYVKNDNELEQ